MSRWQPESPEDRFWRKVDVREPNECWIWLAGCGGNGYPQFNVPGSGRGRGAHRWAFFFETGRWPAPDLELDHLCRVPKCVNPRHLEEVPHMVNMLRARDAVTTHNRNKTHCDKGHPLSGDNLYVYPNRPSRACKTCRREDNRAFYARLGTTQAEFSRERRRRLRELREAG